MNLLLSCIGKRSYIADYFRAELNGQGLVIGTSNTPWTPGFASCDVTAIMPPITSDEYIPSMLDLCARYEVRGVLSFFDPDVCVLARHRDAFHKSGTEPFLPSQQAADTCFDKLEMFKFAEANGVLTVLTTSELATMQTWLRENRVAFPVVVKPRFGFGSANTFIARNDRELEVFFAYAPDMIAQPFIDGRALNVDGLGSLSGKAVSIVPWHKILSRFGETERAKTIQHPALTALAESLIELLGIVGPFDGDFFEDATGRLLLLELNLRFGGGYPVSHLAGADFPKSIVAMLRGEQVPFNPASYRVGVTMMKKLLILEGPSE